MRRSSRCSASSCRDGRHPSWRPARGQHADPSVKFSFLARSRGAGYFGALCNELARCTHATHRRPTSMLLSKVRTTTENCVTVLAVRGEFTGGDETDQLRDALAAETEGNL